MQSHEVAFESGNAVRPVGRPTAVQCTGLRP